MKIIVETEEQKQKLLTESEFIHNTLINEDVEKWSTLGHLYVVPEIIIVEEKDESLV